jgi:endothelin-converting enzyme/putative endopeptidase
MRGSLVSIALVPLLMTITAAQAPTAAPPQPAPAKQPLTELPYTPGLDVTSLDRSVDPCVDFYKFACGTWQIKNPIPPDQARWSVYAKLSDENEQLLWGLLEQAARPDAGRSASEQKIGDFFASCMDETKIDADGATPVLAELQVIDALSSKNELAAYMGRQQMSLGGDGLGFGFGSNQDLADSSQVIAFADAGGLGLPDRDYYTKTDRHSIELRRKYEAHVARMFGLLGEPADRAAVHARTVMAIETALAQASLTNVAKRDPYKLLHKMNRAGLEALTPAFMWRDFLAAQGLGDLDSFNVTEPAFFKAFNRLVVNRPLSAWKTYLKWHVLDARADVLAKPFDQANFDFYSKTLRGVKEQPPRWKRCVRMVDSDLGEALGRVFVEKTFSPETKKKTIEMTKYIEDAMAHEIRTLTWMSDATKARALEKLGTVVNKVGYPERWRDYSELDVVRGDMYGNIVRAATFESKRQLAKIGKPVDRTEWDVSPPTVDAYYNPQLNDINFPAGVLQPPLYDPKMDDAPNYGNTGATIGHELTHGFDDEGRQFDAHGNLNDWWTKEDAAAFTERVKCVQDQYAEYVVVDDIHINSKLTSGEDIADIGGTWLAYLAWRKATEALQLKPIDGFAPDQRFFVGMAQWACENTRPEDERLMAATNPHSPGRYRINGVVSNLPEFAKAFSCKPGQPMVRANVCRIW